MIGRVSLAAFDENSIAYRKPHRLTLADLPGDVDVTLDWRPETDVTLLPVEDDVCSHMLVSESAPVRVIEVGQPWPFAKVKSLLKDGCGMPIKHPVTPDGRYFVICDASYGKR